MACGYRVRPQLRLGALHGCYLRSAGYSTYEAGKFLTTWPRNQTPPCFDHSTVMWGGYNDVGMRTDGAWKIMPGYTTTVLRARPRVHHERAEPGQAVPALRDAAGPALDGDPHPDGTISKLAVPEPKYANAAVGACSGVPEADRSDKPAYVRTTNFTQAKAQLMCQSQLRALMSADDQFGATMQLLSDRGCWPTRSWCSRPTTATCGASTGARRSSSPTSPRSASRCGSAGRGTSAPASTPPEPPRTWTSCRPCWKRPGSPCPPTPPSGRGVVAAPLDANLIVRRVLPGLRERQRLHLEDGAQRHREVHPDLQRGAAR